MGMKNIKNNLIFFSLISFIIFATLFVPSSANAYYYVGWVNGNYIGCETQLDSMGNFVGCGNVNNTNTNTNIIKNNPVPVIYSTSPSSLRLNSGTNVVTINGFNFIPTSTVRFDYSERPTDYVNSKTLKFQLYPSDLDSTGDFSITVANEGPGGGISNIVKFNVNRNVVTSGTTTTKSNTSETNTFTNTNSENNITESNLSGNALSANALYASSNFIPSTFLSWLVIFLLILFIIVLWRKIYISDRDKAMPLKHA